MQIRHRKRILILTVILLFILGFCQIHTGAAEALGGHTANCRVQNDQSLIYTNASVSRSSTEAQSIGAAPAQATLDLVTETDAENNPPPSTPCLMTAVIASAVILLILLLVMVNKKKKKAQLPSKASDKRSENIDNKDNPKEYRKEDSSDGGSRPDPDEPGPEKELEHPNQSVSSSASGRSHKNNMEEPEENDTDEPDAIIYLGKISDSEKEIYQIQIRGEVTLGRNPKRADYVFGQDNHISGVHCALTCHDGDIVIRDNDSKNGTRINGVPITASYVLKQDDIITIGKTEFRVHW